MLATHNPKFLDQTIKVKAIQKIIDCSVPEHFICSKNIGLRQVFWACPYSAADMRVWREISANVKGFVSDKTIGLEAQQIKYNDEPVIKESHPTQMDAYIKSILLPFDYVDDINGAKDIPYIAVTPLPSLGVVHEVFKRGFELAGSNPLIERTLQPNPMSLSNHGESLLMQAGRYRAFQTHIPRVFDLFKNQQFLTKTQNKDDELVFPYLVFKAHVCDANLNAGLISEGLPSITALGGFIHALERKTGQNIDFAVGFRNVGIQDGSKRYIDQSRKNKSNLSKGVVANTRFTLNEKTGSFDIIMLLKCDDHSKLKKVISKEYFRIAGGQVSEIKLGHRLQKQVFQYAWMYKQDTFTDKIDHFFNENPTSLVHLKNENGEKTILERKSDMLDCAFNLHQLYENYNSYSLTSNGYILLEQAKERYNLRTNGYKHAFAEPIFSLIKISTVFDEKCAFWSRFHTNDVVYWQ